MLFRILVCAWDLPSHCLIDHLDQHLAGDRRRYQDVDGRHLIRARANYFHHGLQEMSASLVTYVLHGRRHKFRENPNQVPQLRQNEIRYLSCGEELLHVQLDIGKVGLCRTHLSHRWEHHVEYQVEE